MLNIDLLAALSDSGFIYVYNITNGTYLTKLSGHTNATWYDSILLLNEKYFASYVRNEIIIWSLGENFKNYTKISNAHVSDIKGLKLLKNQLNMVSISWNGLVKIWNTDPFQEISNFQSCTGNSLLEILENDLIAIGCSNGQLKIYDPLSFNLKILLNPEGIKINFIKYLGDDLIALGFDSKISVWDYLKGIKIKDLNDTFSSVYCLESIGKNLLVSGHFGGQIRVWNLLNDSTIWSYSGSSAIFSLKLLSGKFLKISKIF